MNFNHRIIPGDEVARNLSGPSRPAIYKRRPSSPNPNAPIVRANDTTQRAAINEDLSAIRGKLNPVKELQMLARQNSNTEEVNDSSNHWPLTNLLIISAVSFKAKWWRATIQFPRNVAKNPASTRINET